MIKKEVCTGAVVTSDGLWWLFTLAGLQLHFPKHDSFPAWLWVRVGLKKKKKKKIPMRLEDKSEAATRFRM